MTTMVLNLSAALASFGGAAVPESPEPVARDPPGPPPSQRIDEETDVENLLGMFDDVDGEPKSEIETALVHSPEAIDLQSPLQKPGEPDTPLTHGIEFIQNALRSWAIQRNISEYQMQYMQYQQFEAASRSKNWAARSNKLENGFLEHPRPSMPPPHIRIDLSQTPEGAAITAFQEVLAAGCLQVNAQLPLPLSRALRRLYMQIDQLINQGARNEQQWRCMSYGAQIAAHKSRTEKVKIMQVRTQQEFLRQQQIAQQRSTQQVDASPQYRQHISQQQMQLHNAIDLERQCGMQDPVQQPHLMQHHAKPTTLPGKSSPFPSGHIVPASPMDPQHQQVPSSPPHLGPLNGKGVHPKKTQLYGPGLLSRSNQPMKSSFAPGPDSVQQDSRSDGSDTPHAEPHPSEEATKSAQVHAMVSLEDDRPNVDLSSPLRSPAPVRDADKDLVDEDSDRSDSHRTSMASIPGSQHATPQLVVSKLRDAIPGCGRQEATLIDHQEPRARGIGDVA